MSTEQQTPNQYEPTVGPTDRYPLKEWLKRGREWSHNEYIRVIPDPEKRQLRLYRATRDGPDCGFVRTDIDGVRFQFRGDREADPKAFHLHASDAMTLLSLLENKKWDRTDARVTVTHYPDSGKGSFEGEAITEETLRFTVGDDSAKPRHGVLIANAYKHSSNKMASY